MGKKSSNLRIRVTVCLDIDMDAWTTTYGIEGLNPIRRDVREHATTSLTEYYRDLGLLTAQENH